MNHEVKKERKFVRDLEVGDQIRVGSTLTYITRIKNDQRNNVVELTLGRIYSNQAPMILILKQHDHIATGW